jgi:hypothetical protein
MSVRFVNPETVYKPPGYTQVVVTSGPGRTVYVSGQVGLTPDGKLAGSPGDFRSQAIQTPEDGRRRKTEVAEGKVHNASAATKIHRSSPAPTR